MYIRLLDFLDIKFRSGHFDLHVMTLQMLLMGPDLFFLTWWLVFAWCTAYVVSRSTVQAAA